MPHGDTRIPASNRTFDRRAFGLGLLTACVAGRAAAAPSDPIVAWGDSLTEGAGATSQAARYPAVLETLFTPSRPVRNAGKGGERSSQIAARMLADVKAHDAVTVIWAGRNNYDQTDLVLADVGAMAKSVRSGRFLVLSILNADVPEEDRGTDRFKAILTLNDALRSAYGDRFIDIRTRLIDVGLGLAGLAPTAQDRADIARDLPPRALRYDHVHLNDAGQAVVARIVHNALVARGW